jgi:para-nitrobenzyl esterase
MEMPYVFDHLDQQSLPWTAQDRRLASAMAAYWTNFATSGNPNGTDLPAWPEFKSSSHQMMVLGDAMVPALIPDEINLKRIDRVYGVARFATRNVDALAAATVAVIALILTIMIGIRRFSMRRR